MLYYERLANKQYRQNYNTIKYYNRNWWRYYYYQARSQGYNHKKAYQYATDELKNQKKDDESFIIRFLKRNQKKKIPDEKITPLYVTYDLLEESLEKEINRLKKKIKREEKKA